MNRIIKYRLINFLNSQDKWEECFEDPKYNRKIDSFDILDILNSTVPFYEQSIGNWAECPNCKEKDKEIKIFKERIEELAEQRENLHKEKDHRIAVLEKALELCVNDLQREIDGADIEALEAQAIYEIGKDYFIDQAEKELEERK